MPPSGPTGLRFVLDTNSVANPDPTTAAVLSELRTLFEAGRIDMVRTDTMDTELGSATGELRDQLLSESSQFVELLGPMVLDHSRLGHSVVASAEDGARIDRVYAVLRPNGDRSHANSNDLRDAMHIATAIRYGAGFFVTSDKNVLARRAELRDQFDWFTVLSPADAMALARRFIAKDDELQRRTD